MHGQGAMIVAAAALLIFAGCTHAQPGPLDLTGVEAVSTHETYSARGETAAPRTIDGDEETNWSSGTGDLALNPANLLLTFPQPVTVGSIEVLTVRSKGWIRLTHLEVYAEVDGGWAMLGATDDNHEERFKLDLTPAKVPALRLRVRGNERPDNQWAVIREIRLFTPEAGAQPVSLTAAPVADETPSEQIYLASMRGELTDLIPTTTYDPAVGYLGYARSFADAMIEHGTDRYGAQHNPMFASILDLRTRTHPGAEIPPIVGQRQHDRAMFGGNLQHDVPLLIAMEQMTALTGDEKYREAAHDYLRFFLGNCAGTPTGLWPWGEHAHWDFYTESVGHYSHEHLGLPPQSFYDLAWEINPQAVIGEADGCINHVVNFETFDFNRHADVLQPLPEPRPEGLGFLDFARHGGFYLYEWAYAYSKTGDEKYLGWINGMVDHFEDNRFPNGIKMATPERNLTQWSLSLALTMMQAAPLIGDNETGKRVARLAGEYLTEQAADGSFDTEQLQEKINARPPGFNYGYGYGDFSLTNLWVLAHRLTGEQRYLDIARVNAAFYRDVQDVPDDPELRAIVFGELIELLLDMHEFDGDQAWLDSAERYAQLAIERFYHDGLFRGGTKLWYYDSELCVSTLVHALVRLGAVKSGNADAVPALYFHR